MTEREQILSRAKKTLADEHFSLFEKYLPQKGPFHEDTISDAMWKSIGELNRKPVKMPDMEFLSPIIEFEVGSPDQVLG